MNEGTKYGPGANRVSALVRLAIACVATLALSGCITIWAISESAKIPRFTEEISGVNVRVTTFVSPGCTYTSFAQKREISGKIEACGYLVFPSGSKFTLEQRLAIAKELIAREPRIDWPPIADERVLSRNRSTSGVFELGRYFYFPYISKDTPPQWRKVKR